MPLLGFSVLCPFRVAALWFKSRDSMEGCCYIPLSRYLFGFDVTIPEYLQVLGDNGVLAKSVCRAP